MKTIKTVAFIAVWLIAIGCGRRTVQPDFDFLRIDTAICSGAVTCEISYDFTIIANASRSEALAVIEQANILYFFGREAFEGTAREAADEAVEEFAAICDDSFDTPWTATLSVSSVAETMDTVLVYTILRDEYAGGAHGMRSVECHNYSIAGGYELASGDLFTERQAEALAGLIRRKLYALFLADDDEGLARAGFFPEQIGMTENFRITREGITFLYNPYDIACYAVGLVEVAVTNEELDEIRKQLP